VKTKNPVSVFKVFSGFLLEVQTTILLAVVYWLVFTSVGLFKKFINSLIKNSFQSFWRVKSKHKVFLEDFYEQY
jgi:hypothetical protein